MKTLMAVICITIVNNNNNDNKIMIIKKPVKLNEHFT